jgi:hypothetical protein
MRINSNIVIAFIVGALLTVAISLSANTIGENGRYQASLATNGRVPETIYLVVIDTQTGEVVRQDRFKHKDFEK